VYTYDAGTVVAYVNGEKKTVGDGLTEAGTIPSVMTTGTAAMTFCSDDDAGGHLNGQISNWAVWDDVLTDEQAAAVFNYAQPPVIGDLTPTPTACYAFLGDTLPTVDDDCGSHDGTATGTSLVDQSP